MMAKPVSHRAPEFIQGNLEYQVIALGIPRGGFVDDRPRLPGEVEDQVVKLFKPKLSAEVEAKCRARLRLIFATIAEADVAREVYRSRRKSRGEASVQPLNAKRKEKAITLAGRCLASQVQQYRQLRERPSRTREETLLLMEGLTRDIGVSGALKAVLPMNWRWHPGWYRNEQSLELT
jgi:hypothetical protein